MPLPIPPHVCGDAFAQAHLQINFVSLLRATQIICT